MPNLQPSLDASEHVGVGSGENIEAKRTVSYVWNPASSQWERASSLGSNPPSASAVTSVGDSITSATLIAANTSRKEVEFINKSSATLYLLKGAGTASSTNHTVALETNDYYSSDSTVAFVGVWSSDAGGTVLITEST